MEELLPGTTDKIDELESNSENNGGTPEMLSADAKSVAHIPGNFGAQIDRLLNGFCGFSLKTDKPKTDKPKTEKPFYPAAKPLKLDEWYSSDEAIRKANKDLAAREAAR